MKKRLCSLLLALSLLLVGCAQTTPVASESTREFTDSLGRTVTVPSQISKIAISGPLTQVYIIPLAGDMLVGVSNAFASDAALYLPSYLSEKTEIGQLYGGKGEMDLEALLAAAPDVVIDVGEPKANTAEDLDALTVQTGIPFIHISATLATVPQAYRILGELLGREEKAEELAVWGENTYSMITSMMEKVDAAGERKGLLFCLGDQGTNVMAEGSFHAETVNMMSRNLAVVEEVSFSGDGNQVDMEQILLWDPEYVIFDHASCYDNVAGDAQWQELSAVTSGHYYKTPYGPYGWLSSPPGVQRYLGMLWLGALLYPEYVTYDLQEEVTTYYKLFYGCDLTDELYQNLVANALP